jgi:hypothetical protein
MEQGVSGCVGKSTTEAGLRNKFTTVKVEIAGIQKGLYCPLLAPALEV